MQSISSGTEPRSFVIQVSTSRLESPRSDLPQLVSHDVRKDFVVGDGVVGANQRELPSAPDHPGHELAEFAERRISGNEIGLVTQMLSPQGCGSRHPPGGTPTG